VDASNLTAAPNNQPANPPFIRSGHLAAAGFSEHRIYWEEYGSLSIEDGENDIDISRSANAERRGWN
jgi:hypothetical protein